MRRISFFIVIIVLFCCSGVFAIDTPTNLQLEGGPTPVFSQDFSVPRSVSRTSGVAPLSVHFTAGFSASSTTERGFHNYDYSWNFGDPSSGIWGTSKKSKNEAKGPVAAHVFETPGNYTVALTVRDASGVVNTDAFNITVTDPDTVFSGTNTICYSNTSDFTGCPSGATQTQVTDLSTITLTNGRRHLFRRGGTWTYSSVIPSTDGSGPTYIGAFGECSSPDDLGNCSNAPQFTGTFGFVDINDKQDWRIVDLHLVNSGPTNATGSKGDDFQKWLFLRLNIDAGATSIGWGHWNDSTIMTIDEMAIVDCNIADGTEYVAYIGSERLGVLGNIFANSGTTHLVRVWQAYKSVISHNRFSGANLDNSNGRHALKLTGPGQQGAEDPTYCTPVPNSPCLGNPTRFTVVSDNVFGGSGGWPVMISPQSSFDIASIHDIIFERNYIVRDFGTQNTNVSRPLHIVGDYISVRNNVIDGTNARNDFTAITVEAYPGYVPNPTGNMVYNNTIYRSDAASDVHVGIKITSGCTNTIVRNNLVSFASVTGSVTVVSDSGTGTVSSNNFEIDNPSFIDPGNAIPLSRNFSLQPGSSAINKGYNVKVFDDFAGNYRLDGFHDLGAYEK